MEESLSDLLKEHEELEHSATVLRAMTAIIERTPGASTLEDAERHTGRSWMDLLVDETGLTPQQIGRAAERITADDTTPEPETHG